jgi:methenyltetrahydromethanopterin cyclohydrolase
VADHASSLGGRVLSTGGTKVIDCGVHVPGGVELGRLMAEVAMADLGTVTIEAAGTSPPVAGSWHDPRWPVVSVATDMPVAACLASQYAGWKVHVGSFFGMASGPIRAAIGREALFDHIGYRGQAEVGVGLLEAAVLPPEIVCHQLAEAAGVSMENLLLLVAPTASAAGTLQVVARSLETALHQLHVVGFDLSRVQRGRGRAPLAPVAADDLTAIGRTNDAILYGGHVVLEVTGDDDTLAAAGARAVSMASPAHGSPFCEIFRRAGGDFYAIDPTLFAPAVLEFINLDTGRRHAFGSFDPDTLATSFGASPASGVDGSGG